MECDCTVVGRAPYPSSHEPYSASVSSSVMGIQYFCRALCPTPCFCMTIFYPKEGSERGI
eukprot:scaffold292803_cov22-Tisochrysis_lutea.AAC.1